MNRPKNYSVSTCTGGYLSKVRRERDPIPWRYCLMVLFCVVFLASGFIYAAKKHFEAMDYSIKNEKLLKQIEELENEQRRLRLRKEEALSPAEIKKAARKLGFREISAENIEIVEKTSREEKSETQEDKRNHNQKSSVRLKKGELVEIEKDNHDKNRNLKDDKNSKQANHSEEKSAKASQSVKKEAVRYSKDGKSSAN